MFIKRISKRVGYVRVSMDDQNLDLRRDALTKSGAVAH
jgi:DNA invertase Pin-like site-specific DNA recombinase